MDKRYFLFAFDDPYRPLGGASDFEGIFDSIKDAKSSLDTKKFTSAEVACFDGKTLITVSEYGDTFVRGKGYTRGWIDTDGK